MDSLAVEVKGRRNCSRRGEGRRRRGYLTLRADRSTSAPATRTFQGDTRMPVSFARGLAQRLSGTGLMRSAAALSLTTVLGLVPLFTVAFVYVARYPLF